jgi:hypothetical protein
MEHCGASGKIENTTPSPYQPGDDLNNESHTKTKFFFSNIKFCLIYTPDGGCVTIQPCLKTVWDVIARSVLCPLTLDIPPLSQHNLPHADRTGAL